MHALQFAHILPAITYGAGLEDHKSGFGTDSSADPARSPSTIFTASFSHSSVGNSQPFSFWMMFLFFLRLIFNCLKLI